MTNCFHFGKYRHIPFSKVPLQYLQWQLKKNSGLWAEVRTAVEAELARRLTPPKEIKAAPAPLVARKSSYEEMQEEMEAFLIRRRHHCNRTSESIRDIDSEVS